MQMSYKRFIVMIVASTAVMFVLTYFNTFVFAHVYFSQTRFWMALVMGAAMAIVLLSFMLGMYKDKRANVAIFAASAIAILTSERAQIRDPHVRRFADEIIAAQRRGIAEMKELIADLERR